MNLLYKGGKQLSSEIKLKSLIIFKNMSQYNVDRNGKEKLDPKKAANTDIEEVF